MPLAIAGDQKELVRMMLDNFITYLVPEALEKGIVTAAVLGKVQMFKLLYEKIRKSWSVQEIDKSLEKALLGAILNRHERLVEFIRQSVSPQDFEKILEKANLCNSNNNNELQRIF